MTIRQHQLTDDQLEDLAWAVAEDTPLAELHELAAEVTLELGYGAHLTDPNPTQVAYAAHDWSLHKGCGFDTCSEATPGIRVGVECGDDPPEGWTIVERCDACDLFESDLDAGRVGLGLETHTLQGEYTHAIVRWADVEREHPDVYRAYLDGRR